jgi:hypothetical protein
MKLLVIVAGLLSSPIITSVNFWECGGFEGARITASDGSLLGKLGPSWQSDSIFNESASNPPPQNNI